MLRQFDFKNNIKDFKLVQWSLARMNWSSIFTTRVLFVPESLHPWWMSFLHKTQKQIYSINSIKDLKSVQWSLVRMIQSSIFIGDFFLPKLFVHDGWVYYIDAVNPKPSMYPWSGCPAIRVSSWSSSSPLGDHITYAFGGTLLCVPWLTLILTNVHKL